MNVELLIRQGSDAKTWRHVGRGAEDLGIRVKATHLWFEGPDDLHIHLKGFDGPLQPLYSGYCGDYIIPDPSGPGFVRCHSIMIKNPNRRCAPIPDATQAYMKRLAHAWDALGCLLSRMPAAEKRRLNAFIANLERKPQA
ncbi:hypothetical protein EBT31_11100 [bacterium]|jgi:hypothetical protein|nr:hypothetical protein [bacterium]